MSSLSAVNDTIFKAFMNLFNKCDIEKTNSVRKSDLVKIISSSVGNQNPNVEDLIISIIGHHDNDHFMTRNEFTSKIEKYMKSNQECVEKCKEQRDTDYVYQSPHYCLNTSDSSLNEKNRLEALCDDLKVQVQNAEEQNTKLRDENYRIGSSYEQLIAREKDLQQLFEELQNDLSKKENRCAIQQRRLTESEKALEKEKEKCQELLESLKIKGDQLTAVLVRLKSVEKQNEELKKEAAELEKRLELKEDESISCHKRLTDLETSFVSELTEYLKKIDTLEKSNLTAETEMLQGLARIQQLTALNEDLEMKYRMLKDSTALNGGEHCFDSTLSEIESNEEPTEVLEEEDHKTSTVDSGCYDSLLSIRDEMEAEGESFDNFVSFVEYDNQELIDKINNQQKTIDTLTELIDKEKENHKLSFEELEKCKKDLIDCRNTIDVLKKEKQEMEEKWKRDKLLLNDTTQKSEVKTPRPNCQPKGCLTISKRDPEIRLNIERQQMTIRKLVEKFSEKSAPNRVVLPDQSLPVVKCEGTESKLPVECCRHSNAEKKDLQVVVARSPFCPKEEDITDSVNVSNVFEMPSSEIKDDYHLNATRDKSTSQKIGRSCRLSSYRDCLLHPLLLCVWLVLALLLLLQWALRWSVVSCVQSPSHFRTHPHQRPSPFVAHFICPYVTFTWKEPPPF